MLEEVYANGMSADWVLGDEVYGNAYKLRNWCMEHRQSFALGVSTRHCMWIGSKQVRMGTLLNQVRDDQWVRLSTGDGTKGPRRFDWTTLHQVKQPLYDGFSTFIVARRSLEKEKDVAMFSVFARHGTPMKEIVRAIGQRWKIEECFEGAKGQVGLDHYEVRSWHGWHRHMTLCLWAYAYLVHCACREHQKKARGT